MRSIHHTENANNPQQQQPATQVFYANVSGNIQQVGGLKNGNKSIKLLMNMQQQANNSNSIIPTPNNTLNIVSTPASSSVNASPANNNNNQLDQVNISAVSFIKEEPSSDIKPQLTLKETSSPAIPNMNGDNTLLKALLQTAPKNAIAFSGHSAEPVSTTDGAVVANPTAVTLVASETPIVLTQDMILGGQLSVAGKQEPTVHEAGSNEGMASEQLKKKSKCANKTVKQQAPGGQGMEGKGFKVGTQAKSSTLKLNEGIIDF